MKGINLENLPNVPTDKLRFTLEIGRAGQASKDRPWQTPMIARTLDAIEAELKKRADGAKPNEPKRDRELMSEYVAVAARSRRKKK